jgi:hypothetical protein
MGVGRKLQIAMELVKSDKAKRRTVVVLLVLTLCMVTGAFMELVDVSRLPEGSPLLLNRIRRQAPPEDALGQDDAGLSNNYIKRQTLPLPGWLAALTLGLTRLLDAKEVEARLPNSRFKRQTLTLNEVRPTQVRYQNMDKVRSQNMDNKEYSEKHVMKGKVSIMIFFGSGMLFGGLVILATIFCIHHLKLNTEVELPQLEGLPDQVNRASDQEDQPPSYASSVHLDHLPSYQEIEEKR